jgi:hypothetical protein
MEERMEYKYAVEIAEELKWQIENGKQPLKQASQHIFDIKAWEIFLERYKPKSIIELGTGDGEFSKWLLDRIDWFLTIDHKEPQLELYNYFIKLDILKEKKEIKKIINSAPKPLVLYCDNGDKPREVELFSPYLTVEDYLATHDYQIEIHRSDVPEKFDLLLNQGLTAFFKIRSVGASYAE